MKGLDGASRCTQAKREKVGERSRGVIDNVELARLKQNKPIGSHSSKGFGNAIAEIQKAKCIKKTQDSSH